MTAKEQLSILDQWLDRHRGLIFKIVRVYATNVMDRDDLFQEIIIQVWNSVPSFRKESSVTTWLYRISLNTAIKWTVKEKRHNHVEGLESVQHMIDDNKMPMDDRLAWLYEEIYLLDEIDRSITLLLLDGFSYKEMAAMLGITESNIGVKINRIKKQLIIKSKKNVSHGI